MVYLTEKYMVGLLLILILLTACSTKEDLTTISTDEETAEVEEVELVVIERVMQVNADGLATPIEILAEWGDMTSSEKTHLMEASLEYQIALGEMEGTPIKVEGSTEAFVEAMDVHYLELEKRTDDMEKNDLMNSLIAEQVGFVGHSNHLMELE
ncbi:hypothetical protein [Planococcus koreensis]|uniref:hypothetical protein n=1 Tax=Planococcus koreensis TaxID=112331 RepID=UPI0039FC17DD